MERPRRLSADEVRPKGKEYILHRLSRNTSMRANRFLAKHTSLRTQSLANAVRRHRKRVDQEADKVLNKIQTEYFQSSPEPCPSPMPVQCKFWPSEEELAKEAEHDPMHLWTPKNGFAYGRMKEENAGIEKRFHEAHFSLGIACGKQGHRRPHTGSKYARPFHGVSLRNRGPSTQPAGGFHAVKKLHHGRRGGSVFHMSSNDKPTIRSDPTANTKDQIRSISLNFGNLFSRKPYVHVNSSNHYLENSISFASKLWGTSRSDSIDQSEPNARPQTAPAPYPSRPSYRYQAFETQHAFINHERRPASVPSDINTSGESLYTLRCNPAEHADVAENELAESKGQGTDRKRTGTGKYLKTLTDINSDSKQRTHAAQPLLHVIGNAKSKHLRLSHRGLSTVAVSALAKFLGRNEFIETLDLSMNASMEDLGSSYIMKSLKYNKTLIELDLCGCNVGYVAIADLCHSLEYNYTLKSLRLGKNNLDDECLQMLQNTLVAVSKTLTTLDLQKNIFTESGAHSCGRIISASAFNLKSLNLAWNKLSRAGGIAIAQGILEAMADSAKPVRGIAIPQRAALRSIDLSWTGLTDEAGVLLGEILADVAKTPLVELHMSHNLKLTVRTAKAIADGLEHNSKLRHLSLSHCSLTEIGVLYIVKSLGGNLGLEMCKLENNHTRHVQYLHEAVEVMLQRQLRARSARFGQGVVAQVVLEFPYRANVFSRGFLRHVTDDGTNPALRYREILGIQASEAPAPFDPATKDGFSLKRSIFRGRERCSDSKSHLDATPMIDAVFDADWERISSKKGIADILMLSTPEDAAHAQQEIDEIKDALRRRYRIVKDLFLYYSSLPNAELSEANANNQIFMTFMTDFGIDETGWKQFAIFCKLTGKGQQRLQTQIHHLFHLANEEIDDTKQSAENDLNPDGVLMRFEFLEAILRTAILKYVVVEKQTNDYSDAVDLLFDANITRHLHPEIVEDADYFRRTFLYTKQMEHVLQQYYDFAQEYFDKYANEHNKYGKAMSIQEWLQCCSNLGIAQHKQEYIKATLIFKKSVPVCRSEFAAECRTLNVLHFLEALARAAEACGFYGSVANVHPSEYLKKTENEVNGIVEIPDFSTYRYVDLQKQLTARSLDTVGCKEELAKRLHAAVVADNEAALMHKQTNICYFRTGLRQQRQQKETISVDAMAWRLQCLLEVMRAQFKQ